MSKVNYNSGKKSSVARRLIKVAGQVIGILVLVVLALVIYVQLTWNKPYNRPDPQISVERDEQTVARGEYLYKYSNLCWTCHGSEGSYSNEEPQAGGRVFDLSAIGPGMGIFYASNITQSSQTGIGDWTDGEILRSIREGVDNEGRFLLPVMPFQFYHGLSDQDAGALVAYLRTLPAVENQVPENQPSFIVRALITFRFLKPEPPIEEPVTAPEKSVNVEYGEYLVWNAAGCSECHTPRNPNNGKIDFEHPLSGGLFAFEEEGFSTTGTNLTPDEETGLGRWTEAQFMTAMQEGVRPDGRVMVSFMPWPYYSKWDEDDLRAIWLYLRSLEPVSHSSAVTELKGEAVAGGVEGGQALYKIYCIYCHGEKGSGGDIDTMVMIDVIQGFDDAALKNIILNGLPPVMPGFGKTLDSGQVDDLITAILSWK